MMQTITIPLSAHEAVIRERNEAQGEAAVLRQKLELAENVIAELLRQRDEARQRIAAMIEHSEADAREVTRVLAELETLKAEFSQRNAA